MSDQKLRIGIIGIGWYAGTELIPKLRETGRVEIVAIARRSADRLALAQQELNIREAYIDWREMLEKSALDAVVVCTPPNAHTEPTLAALERGAARLCGKADGVGQCRCPTHGGGNSQGRPNIDGGVQRARHGKLAHDQALA